MSVRFIGNKQKLLEIIVNKVLLETGLVRGTFVDLFSGTSAVTSAFKQLGFNITSNDKLNSSVEFAKATLLVNEEPQFERLLNNIDIDNHNILCEPYDLVLGYLNRLPGVEGLFYKEYSPGGSHDRLDEPRQYFTDQNARKIDAIRKEIDKWTSMELITNNEKTLLLCSLMLATNQIANISGTYGAYLKTWYERALQPLELKRFIFYPGHQNYQVFCRDANQLVRELPNSDIIYIDPPYTKRQYHAYYHILETIAIGDEPKVWGKTGQRPKREEDNSLYCYKRLAAGALSDLINNAKCNHLFLSYSTDGHIKHDEIIDILTRKGSTKYWDVKYKRFKSNNSKSSNDDDLKERLYYVRVYDKMV